MWEVENGSGIVRIIKRRVSQQQIQTLLSVCCVLFLICMAVATWQFIMLNFEYMMIALVFGLIFSQMTLAIDSFFYEGDPLRWSELLSR